MKTCLLALQLLLLNLYAIALTSGYEIHDEVIREIWTGENPFDFVEKMYADKEYPHCNLNLQVVEAVLKECPTKFWLEVGSMIGNSAIRTAKVMQSLNNTETSIICLDPFLGDVNMLAWEKELKEQQKWRFARNEKGRCTIYDRFRANIVHAGFQDRIVPIQATGIVGMKLLVRLKNEERISALPGIIYLDSAHELEETMLELRTAWTLLPSGGVLLGDDWAWDSVRHDVTKFVRHMKDLQAINIPIAKRIQSHFGDRSFFIEEFPVILVDGQWIIVKQ